ncbi:calcium-binding protein [Nostoc sp. C117]|uniref:calcium-binding protein n=1 Tax=Nostoc sp. C117 TaxID=3349875 RepID=UPI00370D24A5
MPGTTFTTAQNIGILTSFNFNDAIANANPVDYYKFSLTATNNITFLLNGVTQNYLYAKIYYDSNNNGLIDNGDELYSDVAGSGRNGQITTTLGAGNYYVGIGQNSSNVNSNYSLQLSATSAPPSIASNPGNTLSTAYNIGTLTSTQTIKEFVGSVDPVDYYKFSLTSTNDVTFQLSGVTQNYLDVAIYYDKNNNGLIETGEQLYIDYAGSSRNGQITTTLGAGSYYIGIFPDANYNNVNSNYSLQLSATSAPPSIASNPGNTLGSAYNIGTLTSTQTIKEFVGSVDPVDYYKFSLTSTNDVTFQLSGVTQNYLDVAIYYDKNNNGLIETGEQLYIDYAGSSRNGQITTTLGAGSYYIGIFPDANYSNVNSNYSLQLAATSAPPSIASNPGNTLGSAYNIGTLTSTQTIKEFVGSVDPVDYYKFSLTSTNDVTFQLSGVTQNYLDVAIYYDKNNNGLIETGEQLYIDYAGSSRNGQITTTLGAGSYYIGIFPDANYNNVNSNYSLQLSATSAPPSIASNPGNTLGSAYNIGTLTSTQTIKEFVGSVDPVDYYKFSLTSTNDVTFQLSGVTQNYLDVAIYYDKNNNGLIETGEQLYIDYAGSSRNGQITTTLGAGSYYIGIFPDANYNNVNSNYSLQLSATSAPPSIASNPGNTLGSAYNIGTLTGTQTIKEFVGSVDPVDYYKFSLTSTNDVTFQLSGVTQNYLDVAIYYDKNNNGLIETGEQLYIDYAGSSRNGQITTTLGAGSYYIGIFPDANYNNVNSNYSLQLSATSAPPSISSNPGNTLSTAYNIGLLTGSQTFTEFLGNVDPIDYYKFSLTGTNDITLLLSGVTQNYLDAKIYYDSNNNGLIDTGEQIYSDYAGSSRNSQVTRTLQAGNYYVGISQDSNNINSNYSLQLVNITNPNPNITLTVGSPPSVAEDGTTNLVYTFTRTGSTTNALTVNYNVGGTATLNTDYSQTGAATFTATTGTITFAAGSSTKTLTIDPTADTTVESDETVAITLTASTRYTIGTTTALTGTITNDDVSSVIINLSNSQTTNATGGAGNDRLTGNTLNNTLIGLDGNDQLQGLAGNDTLQGGNGNDILTGGTGDDFLWGGLGDDILTGGSGKDKYVFQGNGVFSTSLGVDYISEFEAGQDQIVLSKTTFNAVTNTVGQALTDFAVVSDDQFVNGSNAHIVFSQSSGSLFYNRDGNVLGTGTVFEFATLGNPDITLSTSNFTLIA